MKYTIPVTAEQFEGVSKRKSKSDEKKKIEEELAELKKLATSAVSEAVRKEYGMEYMDYDKTSDDELLEKAQAQTEQRLADEKGELTRKSEEQLKVLNEKIENRNKQSEEEKKTVEERYDRMKGEASDDALKRGLGRSSVIVNLLKEYDGKKAKAIDEKEQVSNDAVTKLNDEIAQLKQKLDYALKEADMRTAFEVNEELTKLKAERDKENEKALRYNNNLAEKLGELKIQLEKSKTRKHIITEAEALADRYDMQMQDKLLKYYESLSSKEAKEDFENGSYESILSPGVYKRVKTYLDMRK